MDASQVDEWRAFNQLEPFGEDRADFRSGQMAVAIGRMLAGETDEPIEVWDFMLPHARPTDDPDDDEQTLAEGQSEFERYARAMGKGL